MPRRGGAAPAAEPRRGPCETRESDANGEREEEHDTCATLRSAGSIVCARDPAGRELEPSSVSATVRAEGTARAKVRQRFGRTDRIGGIGDGSGDSSTTVRAGGTVRAEETAMRRTDGKIRRHKNFEREPNT